MRCHGCNAEVSESARYCSACGELVDSDLRAVGRLVHANVNAKLEELIESKFADRQLVERQLVEQVSKRLLHWSQLLLAFTALPLALIAIVLALFGWRNYSDFVSTVGKARRSVDERVRSFERQVAGFDKDLKEIETRINRVRASVAQSELLQPRVLDLEERLNTVETELQIDRDVPAATTKALRDFQAYLVTLGLQPSASKLRVMRTPQGGSSGVFLTADGTSTMKIDPSVVNQPDVCMTHYFTHILLSYRRMFHEASPAPSLITALSNYFAASFTDDPQIGEGISKSRVVNLSHDVPFSDVRDDDAWASAFWNLRQRFGRTVADRLLFDAWFKTPDDDPLTAPSFVALITTADRRNFGGRHVDAITKLFPISKVNTKSLWEPVPQ